MITVTLISPAKLDEELLDLARAHNKAGNPVKVPELGGKYVYTTTIPTESVEQYADEKGASVLFVSRNADEETKDYIDRMKPILLQSFADLQTGGLLAIHFCNTADFLLMKAQPEWPKEVGDV